VVDLHEPHGVVEDAPLVVEEEIITDRDAQAMGPLAAISAIISASPATAPNSSMWNFGVVQHRVAAPDWVAVAHVLMALHSLFLAS